MSARKRLKGSTSYAGLATVNSDDLVPKRTSRAVTWCCLATTAGTFQIFRRDAAGTARSITAAETVTANTEIQIHIDFCTKDMFGRFVDTGGGGGGTLNYIEAEEHQR